MGPWRQTRAIALLPGNVTVVVPAVLLLVGGGDVGWGLGGVGAVLVAVIGIGLIVCGFLLWLRTVKLFSQIGGGTLAPWDPTARLVVSGPYRYMRNPMIAAVAAVLVGESILFGSVLILVWAAIFLVFNLLYFLLMEEPELENRFGEEYRVYKRNVPRWLPRRMPWSSPE